MTLITENKRKNGLSSRWQSMLLLKGCVDMSNSFDGSIRKIRGSRTERDGNLQIINEKYDSICEC